MPQSTGKTLEEIFKETPTSANTPGTTITVKSVNVSGSYLISFSTYRDLTLTDLQILVDELPGPPSANKNKAKLNLTVELTTHPFSQIAIQEPDYHKFVVYVYPAPGSNEPAKPFHVYKQFDEVETKDLGNNKTHHLDVTFIDASHGPEWKFGFDTKKYFVVVDLGPALGSLDPKPEELKIRSDVKEVEIAA